MPIEKLKPSLSSDQERLRALQQLVPEVFADGQINWETLRELLTDRLENEATEHFGLFWPGKSEARRFAAQPSTGTLVPLPGEGIEEATSQNIFIEGENLEVLKLLQRSYVGRIKMIYIDPPYNTGQDFVYKDNFTEPLEDYLKRTSQMDDEGSLLTTNKKANGRFHSNWLNMIYPRLRVARDLLSEDGILFVSIGDDEVDNLKKVCNEIFGEENFIAQFVWNTEGHTDNQFPVKVNHEYILLFAKNEEVVKLGFVVDPNTRQESNLWQGFAENSITKNGPANPASVIELPAGFPCLSKSIFLPPSNISKKFFEMVELNGYISRELTEEFDVTYPIRLDEMEVKGNKLVSTCRVFSGWANRNKLLAFIKNGCEAISEGDDQIGFYLSERGVIYYKRSRENARNIVSVLRNMGTTERARAELETMGITFRYPKPKELLSYLLRIGDCRDNIVLDFFAGTGTIAHALFQLNKEDGGNRKFICVQIPESIDSKKEPAAAKFGNLAELCKARIRAASKKTSQELLSIPDAPMTQDFGFRVFKLKSSNFRAWRDYSDGSVNELEDLFSTFEAPLIEGWDKRDVLTEILLLEGFPLHSKFAAAPAFTANEVIQVESEFSAHRLFICLEPKINDKTSELLAGLPEVDIFICLDSALDDDAKVRLSDVGRVRTI